MKRLNKFILILSICLIAAMPAIAQTDYDNIEINLQSQVQQDMDLMNADATLDYDVQKQNFYNDQMSMDANTLGEMAVIAEYEEFLAKEEQTGMGYQDIPGFTYTGDPEVDDEAYAAALAAHLVYLDKKANYEAHGYHLIPGFTMTGNPSVDDVNHEAALEQLSINDPAAYQALFSN